MWCSGFIAAISSATSSGVTPRCSAIQSKYSSSDAPRMCPGATQFTRIPSGPSSRAIVCAAVRSALFDAAYPASNGIGLRTDSVVIITIEPPPAALRCGTARLRQS